MGIELLVKEEKLEITKENFADSIKKIKKELEPGMPVMIHNYSHSSLSMSRNSDRRYFFFSGGNLSEKGYFDIQKGSRNSGYIDMDKEKDDSYRIALKNEDDAGIFLSLPEFWTHEQYNEGTFSSSGPETWHSHHSAGTKTALVGRDLEDKFPGAFNALRFIMSSTRFQLPIPYARQEYLITEIGDSNLNHEEEKRDSLTHRIARVRAALNLLELAGSELKEFSDNLCARQVGWFHEGVQRFREKGYPVNSEDYLIFKCCNPNEERNIAFLRTEGVQRYGEMFILPYNQGKEKLIEHAFSDENVNKLYPAGR